MSKPIDISLVTGSSVQKRFWSKVDKNAGSFGCWSWMGHTNENGYGVFYVHGSAFYAHRIAFSISESIDPGSKMVCHKCDNTTCVNPAHLFLGTASDNNRDMLEKNRGRWLAGDNQPNAKLTNAQIKELRDAFVSGFSTRDLATMYGINASTVNDIVTGKSYRGAGGAIVEKLTGPVGENHPMSKLNPEIVREIRSLWGSMTCSDLARMFDISRTLVQRVAEKKTWKHVV
jgi:hypothetical protein